MDLYILSQIPMKNEKNTTKLVLTYVVYVNDKQLFSKAVALFHLIIVYNNLHIILKPLLEKNIMIFPNSNDTLMCTTNSLYT